MTQETTNTLVIGAGQAGLAMSEHLTKSGTPHLVLERARIAEAWRSGRWDSLVANGPAWHDRFPSLNFEDFDPDGFPPKERVAAYFEAHAAKFNSPVRCGVEVTELIRKPEDGRFLATTSQGTVEASNVVIATGPFQRPVIPQVLPANPNITQIHSADYKNPQSLPEGGVLVVGAGSSGAQIADELLRAGRDVTLSIGAHDRPPRAYRGRDYCWWLGVLGKWNAVAAPAGTEHVTISVSGAHGGHTVDFRQLAHRGMTLAGMTKDFKNGALTFANDLADNIARGDTNYLSVLDEADAYIARHGLDLPEEPEARNFAPMPDCVTNPILSLDLEAKGITTALWATGYATDFSWIKLPVSDHNGKLIHERGVSAEPGLYFVGLPWQSRRGSAFIWGVWHDAKYLADQIEIQRAYMDYHQSAGTKAAE